MNLSDLVHRTAGDNKSNKNKVPAPNSNNNSNHINSSNNLRLSQPINGYNNLFQQNIIDSNVSPSNIFANFARQDQQFLFSMPNTDWVNNSLFFNNNGLVSGQDSLIEPMNQATSASDMTNLYLKQDFLATNTNQNTTIPATTTTTTKTMTNTTTTINNNSNNYTQQPKNYPLIAPFQRSVFHSFDLSNPAPPHPPVQTSQSIAADFHENDNVQFNTNTFTTMPTAASEIAIAAAQSEVTSQIQTVSCNNSTKSMTTPTTATALTNNPAPPGPSISEQMHIQILKPTVKITGDNVTSANIEEGYIQFVLEHDASYISDGIDSLVYTKRKFQSVPKTGDISYTTWDIYQLVLKLHKQEIKNWSQLVGQLGLHDMAGRPQFAQRVKRWMNRYKIDSYFDYLLGNEYQFNAPEGKYSTCLMIGNYKKRKSDNNSSNVNAIAGDSDDEELENDETDQEHRIPVLLAGSRKRMRDISQNSLQMIENAQKFLRLHQSESEEEEEEEEEEIEDQKQGGSDMDENDSDIRSIVNNEDEDVEMAEGEEGDEEEDEENMQEEEEEEKEEEDEEEELADDEEDELASSASSPISPPRKIIPAPIVDPSPPKSTNMQPPLSTSSLKPKTASPIANKPTISSSNIAGMSPASSSFTKYSTTTASPSFSNKSGIASPSFMHIPIAATSPANSTLSMSSVSSGTIRLASSPPKQAPPPLSLLSIPPLSSCSNCMANDAKVVSMEVELKDLKAHVAQLKSQLEKQNNQVNKLLRLRDRTERWRKQIISDLARGPQVASENDDDDDDDDEDEDDDEDNGEAGNDDNNNNTRT
ncbi:ARS binding protein 2-domain-containing protein [Parasitella parasitica]|nr:ARS binding protein 2-domain-containing protein [Parasitella parasitica]